jgi:ABC-2 type transport system ATP-binding protein
MSVQPADVSMPLCVAAVCKSYGAGPVLKDVGFSLHNGEIFGLVGLNGAGKTTLIKIMLQLATADAGSVSWFGQEAKQVATRRHIAYLPEKFQPSRYLKGKEYLELTLSYYGRRLDMDKAERMAASLDLDPKVLTGKVGGYSKGMGQKLGLLGALLSDTPFLLLDEPMSGLDPRARIYLKEALLAAKKQGKTVFFSSHILSDLDEICDRIGILHQGMLAYLDTPAAFKGRFGKSSLEQAFLQAIEAA